MIGTCAEAEDSLATIADDHMRASCVLRASRDECLSERADVCQRLHVRHIGARESRVDVLQYLRERRSGRCAQRDGDRLEGTARLRSKLWTSGTQPRGRLRTWGYGGMGRDLESTVLAVFG